MDNLKKNLIKAKNQINNSESTNSVKSELKTKNSSSSIGSIPANVYNRSRSESGTKNLNEEQTTKTYFIFEDEDECY